MSFNLAFHFFPAFFFFFLLSVIYLQRVKFACKCTSDVSKHNNPSGLARYLEYEFSG